LDIRFGHGAIPSSKSEKIVTRFQKALCTFGTVLQFFLMQLYSHLVIAHKLLPELQPQDLPEYYWGAIAADIRYIMHLPRPRTHVPVETVQKWLEQYPELRSFTLGYWVHILADERDAASYVYQGLPTRALRRRLRRLAAVWLEAALVEKEPLLDIRVSGTCNAILAELGVLGPALAAYAEAANRYAAAPSEAVVMEMLAQLGLSDNPRLERYLGIARFFQRAPWARRFMVGLVDVPKVTGKIVTDLRPFLPGIEEPLPERPCEERK
jgi:hypothetical protein